MKNEYWLDGIMGVITGDALGDPVQFESRREVAAHAVTGMRGGGAYDMPAGTWTDDSSMTLATLASILEKHAIELNDIMTRFVAWLEHGEYTPFGQAFDIGNCCETAILRYEKSGDPLTCGGTKEYDNGNGSLMRIMPACLWCCQEEEQGKITEVDALQLIHQVSGLTHNHTRAKIGCGLYYFMVKALLEGKAGAASLQNMLQDGLSHGFAYYQDHPETKAELFHYQRLQNLEEFRKTPVQEIKSSGYVVDTLEAAVWSLLVADSFREALLTAVNLGDDADTVGAVTGGLAGLFYGYGSIPEDWLQVLQKREEIEEMCKAQ